MLKQSLTVDEFLTSAGILFPHENSFKEATMSSLERLSDIATIISVMISVMVAGRVFGIW